MSHPEKKFHPTLLLCSRDNDPMLMSQVAIFNSAGYPVLLACTDSEIEHHLRNSAFDIAVLNHTLSFADRKNWARNIKTAEPATGVLVLHASGALANPNADIAVDSRLGPTAILRTLKRVELMQSLRRDHVRVEDEYLVIVDENRNYVFASDAACRLLGYDRVQFLELRIDDVVAGSSTVAEPLFDRFVEDGAQTGTIILRHRSGLLIKVNYTAEVRSDGSMLARWEPMVTPQIASAKNTVSPHQ